MRRIAWIAVVVGLVLALVPPATAEAAKKPKPVVNVDLPIATLPAFANYAVTLDGVRTLTDSTGVAHFNVASNATGALQARLVMTQQDFTLDGVDERAVPARFYNNGSRRVIILNVYYLVGFSFKNSNNGPLDASAIKKITAKNSIGEVSELAAHTKTWLQGSRVVPLAGGLEVKKIYWTVQDVEYAGTNVVNASQQRFLPADGQQIEVTLLFYSARLKVHDALFGFHRGGSILLVYPDSSTRRSALDSHGSLTLPSLPRGNYDVVIEGFGPKLTQQLAVSTNQDLDLKYYSWIDVAVLALVGLLFTVGLLAIGYRRRRRKQPKHSEPASVDEQVQEPSWA